MSLRTTPRPAGVTRNQIRPALKSNHYVPSLVRNSYGRGFGESRTQYGFQPSYSCVGRYGEGSGSGLGVAGRGGRTERRSWLKDGESGNVSEPNCSDDVCDDISVEASGADVPAPARTFQDFDFGECVNNNLDKSGYVMPTAVQRNAIPIAMAGRDLFVCAPTGAGKTAAFCLPIISQVLLTKTQSPDDGDRWTVFPVGLILTPTKESACQICLEAEKLAYGSGVKVAGVYGGATMAQQLRHLERGVDILVATPSILVDLLERSRVSLKRIKYLALDEADRMLDMDFGSYIRNFIQQMDMPHTRHTLIFTATFSIKLLRLASDFLTNYIFLTVGTVGLKSNTDTDLVAQKVEFVKDMHKSVPNWHHDYSEHSMHNGGDLSQRYGSRYFGGYDVRRSDNHYGSGSFGYGYSSAGAGAATFHEVSGSYAADSNSAGESGINRNLATTGTINIISRGPGELIGAADTREAFDDGTKVYIYNDSIRKIRTLKDKMFALYNGDCPMGNAILDYVEDRVNSNRVENVTIRRVALSAYYFRNTYAGNCIVYFGGIEDQATILFKLTIKHDLVENEFVKELSELKLKEGDMLFDGCGKADAEDYWKSVSKLFEGSAKKSTKKSAKKSVESSANDNIRVSAKLLLRSAFKNEFCGGYGSLTHIMIDHQGRVVCSPIRQTFVKWFIDLFDELEAEGFEKQLIFFVNKNALNETVANFLKAWSDALEHKGSFKVGSPFAKILYKKLFLVHVEVDPVKRTEILSKGTENTTVIPNCSLREFSFNYEKFYVSEPSKALLQSLCCEDVKEGDLIPDVGKVYTQNMDPLSDSDGSP